MLIALFVIIVWFGLLGGCLRLLFSVARCCGLGCLVNLVVLDWS